MVKIRLSRIGSHKRPCYRVVVADSRTPRNGKIIQQLGIYEPLKNPAVINIDLESAKSWINKGAQPTDTVKILLNKISKTSGE